MWFLLCHKIFNTFYKVWFKNSSDGHKFNWMRIPIVSTACIKYNITVSRIDFKENFKCCHCKIFLFNNQYKVYFIQQQLLMKSKTSQSHIHDI